MQKTTISWTDFSSNPLRAINLETGKEGWLCSKVSEGCTNCYAETINLRYGNKLEYNLASVTKAKFILKEKELAKWKKVPAGSKVFICDMTDLFHEAMPDEYILRIFQEMENNPGVTFQVLTKRPERMHDFIIKNWPSIGCPSENIWLGTSVENKKQLYRINILSAIPARVRFLSIEPLLEDLKLRNLESDELSFLGIKWVIVGAESGNNRRHYSEDWARDIRDYCEKDHIPFFYKQGSHRFSGRERSLDGRLHEEFPN